jgi:16S rRNA (cytidine1402-2'-O)-methyltransferase
MYEAPHRVEATVGDIVASFGGERSLVVAREITKAFETIACVPLRGAPAWLAADANRRRGEFVLIVDAPEDGAAAPAVLDEVAERWLAALLTELPPARAARVVAAVTGIARDVVYARAIAIKPG